MKAKMFNGFRWIVLGPNDNDKGIACQTFSEEVIRFSDNGEAFGEFTECCQETLFTEDCYEPVDDDDITDEDIEEYPYWRESDETFWKYIAIREDDTEWFDAKWDFAIRNEDVEETKPLEKTRETEYNKSIGDKNMANTMNGVDVGSLMNMKMVEKLLEKDDFEIKDLMEYQMKSSVMQGLVNGQGVNINDIIRQKMIAKYMLNDKTEDMNFTQLAILNMLQNGRIDINQLVMVKMLEKLDK